LVGLAANVGFFRIELTEVVVWIILLVSESLKFHSILLLMIDARLLEQPVVQDAVLFYLLQLIRTQFLSLRLPLIFRLFGHSQGIANYLFQSKLLRLKLSHVPTGNRR
jgi:hypothetical protein